MRHQVGASTVRPQAVPLLLHRRRSRVQPQPPRGDKQQNLGQYMYFEIRYEARGQTGDIKDKHSATEETSNDTGQAGIYEAERLIKGHEGKQET